MPCFAPNKWDVPFGGGEGRTSQNFNKKWVEM